MQIMSVDLACRSYENLGIVTLVKQDRVFVVKPFTARDIGLTGEPSAHEVAGRLTEACDRMEISILVLDGPQGWKHPENGLVHCRVCEKELNTQGKTGLPGKAKPKNYLPFISFSIAVFQALVERGFRLFADSTADKLALESYPQAAWKTLGLKPLPSKRKASSADLSRAADALRRLFPVQIPEGLTHDELQALVAAFAGAPFARGQEAGYEVAGIPPTCFEDTWREGFIINPTRNSLSL